MSSISSLLKNPSPDAEEVVKACNAALKESKSDALAQHAKIVALLNLDRYEDALRTFETQGDGLKSKAAFEYAYALYKTGQLEKAKEIIGGLSSKGAKHLKAQASYRLEDFATASEIYRELWESRDASEESDLRPNIGATDAQLQWARQAGLASKTRPGREDLEAFETAYNAACGCIARGELSQAEVLLRRARDLCNASEILSETEKQDELVPIMVQLLCVLASLGKFEQVQSLSKELLITENADASTRMLAQMNQQSTSGSPLNPYLSQRLLKSYPALPQNDQLFSYQTSILRQNETALDLLAFKYNGVIKSTSRQLSENASPSIAAEVTTASSANAAAHAQNRLGKLGLASILPLLEKRPKDVGLITTIIQLYVLTNNFGAAATVFDAFVKRLETSNTESDLDVRHSPGLVAIAVSLYSKEGRRSHMQSELTKAASYWRRKSKCPPELLRVAGLSSLGSTEEHHLQEAGKIFGTLYEQDDTDRFAGAGLVASYAQTDFATIRAEAEKLTDVSSLIKGIDVEALENAGIPQSTETATTIISRKRAATGSAKPKKKRKSKLPKDYDPDKKPDPERWLPLRDRSTYKPKGKKNRQKQAALTQGGIEKEQAVETPKATPAIGASAKAKKKKGKK